MIPFIDADNAMGSRAGDVDDGFAVALMLVCSESVAALASVRGNASEEEASRNNRRLAGLCRFEGPLLRGAGSIDEPGEASQFLLQDGPPLRFVALGPLTNLAGALVRGPAAVENRVREVVVVGANASSKGRWPPLWPHEFNLTKDLRATRVVFDSNLPLVIAPLDLLRRMRVGRRDLRSLEGELGSYLRKESQRWLRRAALLKWSSTFPVWDLVAAMYALGDESILTGKVKATLHPNGRVEFGRGTREVTIIRDFDRDRIWRRFEDAVNGHTFRMQNSEF